MISEISCLSSNDLKGLRLPTVLCYVLYLSFFGGFDSHTLPPGFSNLQTTKSLGKTGATRSPPSHASLRFNLSGASALLRHWRVGRLLRFCLVVRLGQKAVWYPVGVAVDADDLTGGVDAPSQSIRRVREVERDEIRPGYEK